MTTFDPNTQFGNYRILRLLGQGGMADVCAAEDTTIVRKVALKILSLAFASDERRARYFTNCLKWTVTWAESGMNAQGGANILWR